MAKIYGIDLGHHTVRLSEFEGSFGRLTYLDCAEMRVAQDKEAPADLTTRLAALDQLFELIERHASDIHVVGFPCEQASVRRIHLPFEDKEKVKQALPFEVENQVPFDLDDMLLASRTRVAASGGSSVLCGMAPQDSVSSMLDALTERGVDPKSLIIDADLLGQYAIAGVQVVLDLGHTRTLVALCVDGRVVDVRSILVGGRDLTMAMATGFDLSFEEAERLKHSVGLDNSDEVATAEVEWNDIELTEPQADIPGWSDETTAGQITETDMPVPRAMVISTIQKTLMPLLTKLRATLIAMEDRHELDIDEVLLAGGGARLRGLPALFNGALGVGVRSVHVEDGVAPTYALAHAAAVLGAGNSSSALDLRVDDFAFRGNLAAIGNIIRYSILGAAALMLAGVGVFAYKTVALNAEIESLESEMADAVVSAFPDVNRDKVEDPAMAQAIMAEKSAETAARQESLAAIIPDSPPILTLWEAIAQNVPAAKEARIDVRELQISEGTIKLKAETDGFEDASKIEASLQLYPRFKEARKSDEKKVKESVRFTVTIPLESDETEEG
jgi:Tfp pilus assembly PilM family ATPase